MREEAARPVRRPPRLPIPRLAAALAAMLVVPALALSGCAGTRSADEPAQQTPAGRAPGPGEVRLVVSRDFGAKVLRDLVVPATDKLNVLRLLAEHAKVDTGYGGQFVSGIDGLKSSFAGSSANASDWFYWVDGSMADVGAESWKLKGGESVWWDYHRWADSMFIPQALAAFPRPYDEGRLPVAAAQDVPGLKEWAAASGLDLEARHSLETMPRGGLVLATASQAAATPWLTDLLSADRSGVALVKVAPGGLSLLSPDGKEGAQAEAAMVAAPNQEAPERPFLIVLARSAGDLQTALDHVDAASLTAAVGLALVDGRPVHLPWGAK